MYLNFILRKPRRQSKSQRYFSISYSDPGRQCGFLIPLAAFILVAISLLAATIMRTSSQVALAATLEAVSMQAFYAAESGAQAAMSELFGNNDPRATVDTNCSANVQDQVFNVTGLQNCAATGTCVCTDESNNPCPAAGVYSFYVISSSATCGSAAMTSTRTIQVSAFSQ